VSGAPAVRSLIQTARRSRRALRVRTGNGLRVVAVATSAVRDPANRARLLEPLLAQALVLGGGRGDLEAARPIAQALPDQAFSFVDCASFGVMERMGRTRH